MKRLLLYVAAIMFGSFIAQAQPAVELHDVTAAITDSVRIVPNFAMGDMRSYRATIKTVMEGSSSDFLSMDYHMKVESVDRDHYGMFLTLDNIVCDQSDYLNMEQLLELFGTEGVHFYFNRDSMKVDSIDCSNLVKPLTELLIKVSSGIDQAPDEDSTQLLNDDGLDDRFINGMASKLFEGIIQTWADQYGRTYAMGDSRWIETDEDLENTEVEDIDTDIQDENVVVEEFEVSVQWVHQAFAHINEDGTFFYRDTISWESLMLDNWSEHKEASFDAKGWPVEINNTTTMGDATTTIHWQLIEEDD